MRYLFVVGLLWLACLGCAPAVQDTRPALAVMNAPSELRVPGAAEYLIELLSQEPQGQRLAFSRGAALRFQETHRDMSGDRAPLQAAFIARSQGAAFALMAGFELRGSLRDFRLNGRYLEVDFSLEGRARAALVDPETALLRGSYASRPFSTVRSERLEYTLPDGVTPESAQGVALLREAAQQLIEDAQRLPGDPVLAAALAELAAPVAATLESLFAP